MQPGYIGRLFRKPESQMSLNEKILENAYRNHEEYYARDIQERFAKTT
jgi:hypothetical protein